MPFIAAWIGYHNRYDYRGPTTPDFKTSVELKPSITSAAPATLGAQDWALLQHYAPIIEQETSAGAAYPAAFDQFGTVSLVAVDQQGLIPQVDSAAPALYSFIDEKKLQGRRIRQLVYTLWYPQHPKMKGFDPKTGRQEPSDSNVEKTREQIARFSGRDAETYLVLLE